jgi:exonuclease VII large subunit
MKQGPTLGSEAPVATALTQARLTAEELQAWQHDLANRLRVIEQHPEQNLGHIEEQLAQAAQEPLRLLTQRAAQLKANATPCRCPVCQRELSHRKFLARTITSRFGPWRLYRQYGWCAGCETWHFPADYALGLDRHSPASPYIQELCALLVSKMPADQARAVAQRLGLRLSTSTLHREACRQGRKAERLRDRATAQLDSWEGLTQLAGATDGPPTAPFTLVIEIDAWNIRERDDWGRTKDLVQQGQKPERYHWVYMGTVFRLDHRGQTAGERALISQRGYVATRHGLEALLPQLYREAIARGLGQAQRVLVIADGAVWIWNLADDRFKGADQRLDLFHADEHLWAVAHDLYGHNTPEARQWVAPLLTQVRQDQTPGVIHTLTELLPRLTPALQAKVQKQIAYFKHHQNRMKYKAIVDARQACKDGIATPEQKIQAQEPLGSGAIESTCRQYQCRFKRTGQFWTVAGDESLMCLETLWRNNRWSQLFPHAQAPSIALN